jgi:hypothetical protein
MALLVGVSSTDCCICLATRSLSWSSEEGDEDEEEGDEDVLEGERDDSTTNCWAAFGELLLSTERLLDFLRMQVDSDWLLTVLAVVVTSDEDVVSELVDKEASK